jgi:hypothetical protein
MQRRRHFILMIAIASICYLCSIITSNGVDNQSAMNEHLNESVKSNPKLHKAQNTDKLLNTGQHLIQNNQSISNLVTPENAVSKHIDLFKELNINNCNIEKSEIINFVNAVTAINSRSEAIDLAKDYANGEILTYQVLIGWMIKSGVIARKKVFLSKQKPKITSTVKIEMLHSTEQR